VAACPDCAGKDAVIAELRQQVAEMQSHLGTDNLGEIVERYFSGYGNRQSN
jgi:hypothetical protein